MKSTIHRYLATLVSTVALLGAVAGCTTPKDVTYIQDVDEGLYTFHQQLQGTLKAEPGDKMTIIVSSKDPSLSSLFTLTTTTHRLRPNVAASASKGTDGTTNTSDSQPAEYTVDEQGDIDFPVVGTIHVGGLTRSQIAEKVKHLLISQDLIKDPTVIVEFTNRAVNVLGAVNTPGRYRMDRDQMTILEAVAAAGDLSIQGMRNNVAVIREDEAGKVQVYRIDLTSAESIYTSPAYYLQQNDVVYVEPTDQLKRQRSANGSTLLTPSFWLSVATFALSVIVLCTK